MTVTYLKPAPLIAWMRERQAIYRRRQAGAPWPWSTDPIFQANRFCNVFRELDKTTVWLRETWREPYAGHKHLPFAMCLARSVNWPDTLAEHGFPKRWDAERFVRVLEGRRARGDKMITSAHYVYGGGPGSRQVGGTARRIALTLDTIYRELGPSAWVDRTSLRTTFMRLITVYGMGRFTAYEVVTDLRHTVWLRDATDVHGWCNIGIGSRRGLNRLAGRPLGAVVPEEQAMAEVQYLVELVRARLGDDDPMFKRAEMRDVEHSLCELDKYERVAAGEGKMKERYHYQEAQR